MSEQEARNCDLAESLATESVDRIAEISRLLDLEAESRSPDDPDRGRDIIIHEYLRRSGATKPMVWCRCGDGIEDPTCKTCYLTDREDAEPSEDVREAWKRVSEAVWLVAGLEGEHMSVDDDIALISKALAIVQPEASDD